jgi:ornithine--oxo-acid transaminase
MDVSTLAGVLAERLLAHAPYLDKVFFANSGAESVETAIKFARAATGRQDIVYCEHAFHGLSYGALSLNGTTCSGKASDPCCRRAIPCRSTTSKRSKPRWRPAK